MTNREDFILIGRDGEITTLDRDRFEAALGDMPERNRKRLEFMSQDHHRVRYFVVEEMPRIAVPLSAALIAERLDLPGERVKVILEELERNLFFLVRNPEGEVSWAFPVTTEPTPHHMTFSTGERLYGAWAEDAIATPFVEGRLRKEKLSVRIDTECACCGRKLSVQLDEQLRGEVIEGNPEPLVFSPDVDWDTFDEPNITHAYWRNSLFFWSEEHARRHRMNSFEKAGAYLTLPQTCDLMKHAQSLLFAF